MMRATAPFFVAIAIMSTAPATSALATPTTQSADPVSPNIARLDVEDTELSDLLANSAAKAVLDKHLPGLTSHPLLVFMRQLTLREIQMSSPGAIPDEILVAIDADLAKIPV